ncbi:hypothetical protein ROSA5918_21575 [Roseateles saccharophilus]
MRGPDARPDCRYNQAPTYRSGARVAALQGGHTGEHSSLPSITPGLSGHFEQNRVLTAE